MKITCNIREMFSGLTDILFPPRCIICGGSPEEGGKSPFCSECLSKINFIRPPLCPCCGLQFTDTGGVNHLCGDCISKKPLFSTARALGIYDKILLDTIHLFKYSGKILIGERMGTFMAEHRYDSLNIGEFSLIIPVPLHPKKLRERGFNQSLILGRQLSKKFSIPLDFGTLKRRVDTKPQVNLGKSERIKNVKGAFMVRQKERIAGERILLVDDVYTTGSTVNECARVLIEAKASTVAVLTLAKA
ncbi:MAG: ComF family protein [Thermodesulfobacteriota bacterium]|nr:ComF family protein [Thermodesulfobacteriota bacterium]